MVLPLKKAKSRRYPVETITDADYADNMALLTKAPTQAEYLLHYLEQEAGGIDLHENEEKNGVHVSY